MSRPSTLPIAGQAVAQPDIGECPAQHHLVVTAPRSVGIEVDRLDAMLDEVPPGRAIGGGRARPRGVGGGRPGSPPHPPPRPPPPPRPRTGFSSRDKDIRAAVLTERRTHTQKP